MKRLPPKTVIILFCLIIPVGVVFGIIGIRSQYMFLTLLGTAVLLGNLIFLVTCCRCPHCGRYLKFGNGEHCPFCGKDIP